MPEFRNSSSVLLSLMLALLISCKNNDTPLPDYVEIAGATIEPAVTASRAPEGNTGTGRNPNDRIETRTFSRKVMIHYGPVVSITPPENGAGIEVTAAGGNVTVRSTAGEVEYELSGTTAAGSLKITSDKAFKVTLNNVNITNPVGSALNLQSDSTAFVIMMPGTTNTLADGNAYDKTEDGKGTLFSEGPLVLNGTGALAVKSLGKHAIVSDDYVYVAGASITVSEALKDGIHANDAVVIDGGILKITATDDGIQCEKGHIIINDGTISINSTGKAITASYDTDTKIDPYLTLNGGHIKIQSKDEGIESKSVLTVNGGTIEIESTDDAINAGTFLYINGGNIFARSSGNDGIDSNGPLTVTGGTVVAVGAANPEAGVDCDRSTFKITGGIIVGIGGSTSVPTASVSTQRSVVLGGGAAGQLLSILSDKGAEALTFLAPAAYQTLLFSSPKLEGNLTYQVYTGGSVSGADAFGGLYLSGSYEPGNRSPATFTTTAMVTTAGGNTGPGGR